MVDGRELVLLEAESFFFSGSQHYMYIGPGRYFHPELGFYRV